MEFIICWLLFGVVCYCLAEKKNKNTTWAVVGGVLFGIFAVIYYLLCDPE